MLYFFRTQPYEAYIANALLAKSARTFVQSFIFSLKIYSNFAFLISQGTISHILVAIEDMLSVPKNAVWFFLAFAELSHLSDCMISVQSEKFLS